jgi:hypothetical protein
VLKKRRSIRFGPNRNTGPPNRIKQSDPKTHRQIEMKESAN